MTESTHPCQQLLQCLSNLKGQQKDEEELNMATNFKIRYQEIVLSGDKRRELVMCELCFVGEGKDFDFIEYALKFLRLIEIPSIQTEFVFVACNYYDRIQLFIDVHSAELRHSKQSAINVCNKLINKQSDIKIHDNSSFKHDNMQRIVKTEYRKHVGEPSNANVEKQGIIQNDYKKIYNKPFPGNNNRPTSYNIKYKLVLFLKNIRNQQRNSEKLNNDGDFNVRYAEMYSCGHQIKWLVMCELHQLPVADENESFDYHKYALDYLRYIEEITGVQTDLQFTSFNKIDQVQLFFDVYGDHKTIPINKPKSKSQQLRNQKRAAEYRQKILENVRNKQENKPCESMVDNNTLSCENNEKQ